MTTTTVLCTDGSEPALQALTAGLALVRPADRTVIATVIESPDETDVTGTGFAGGLMSPEEFDERRRQQQVDAVEILDQTLTALGLDAEQRVLEGDPGSAICALASEVDATAVVMGSRGRGGIKRALLGSVSDHVVRNAPCTVMVTRADATT
jgi:nucleotide-binding universal stress UspA family protein